MPKQTKGVINDAAPFGRNDVSPLRSEMMLLPPVAMMRCLPSCAAGIHHQRSGIIAEGTSFDRKGKHHSKSSDLVDKSLLFDGGA